MTVTAHLYDPVLDRHYVVKDTTNWTDFETAIYNWFDGNYSCDCNRTTLIEETTQEELYGDCECGEVILLEKLIDDETGKEITE